MNLLHYSLQDGVWVKGLFLEGAGWDKKNTCLVEASPMMLVSPMPTVHFKPVENKKKGGKGVNDRSKLHLKALAAFVQLCYLTDGDISLTLLMQI